MINDISSSTPRPSSTDESGKPVSTPVLSTGGNVGRDPLQIGGYALLTYGFYNLVVTLVSSGPGPEAGLTRIGQFITIFPVLFLGSLFALRDQTETAAKNGRTLQVAVRWLTLLLAVIYLLFIPVSLFSRLTIVNGYHNVFKRTEAAMNKRKSDVMAAISGISQASEFIRPLSQFPEITSIRIDPRESPDVIRQGISDAIDKGISVEVKRSKQQLEAQINRISALAIVNTAGSLICSISFFSLSAKTIPGFSKLIEFLSKSISSNVQRFSREKARQSNIPTLSFWQRFQRGFLQPLQRNFRNSMNKRKYAQAARQQGQRQPPRRKK